MSDNENLFGDEPEEDKVVNDPPSDEISNNDDDDDDGLGLFGDDDDDAPPKSTRTKSNGLDSGSDNESDSDSSVEERPVRIREDVIPLYAPSHRSKDSFFVRVPAFLTLAPEPFDSAKFLEEAKQDEKNDTPNVRLSDENTLRWKYAASKSGGMVKQSNARFVQWSDGSMSLQLGSEFFDVQEQDMYDPTFVCISHSTNEILQTSRVLEKTARFIPTSTASLTHVKLAQALTKKQYDNVSTVRNFATTDDPEKIQREAEKQQMLAQKARRKLESKRQQQEDGLDTGAGNTSYRKRVTGSTYKLDDDEEEELAMRYSTRGGGAGGDDYEEDDFVVNDEDEDEGEADQGDSEDDDQLVDNDGDSDDNADRLRRVKQQGTELYANRDHKKRRIIDDEDE